MIPLVRHTVLALGLAAGALAVPAAAAADSIGQSACTAEVWALDPSGWEEYPAATRLGDLFAVPTDRPDLAAMTLGEVIAAPSARGAHRLLRAAAVAYLNASDERVAYPFRRFGQPFHIEAAVDDALADGNGATMRRVTRQLEAANRLPCPVTDVASPGGFGASGPQAAPTSGRLPDTGPSMLVAFVVAAAAVVLAFGIALRAVRHPR